MKLKIFSILLFITALKPAGVQAQKTSRCKIHISAALSGPERTFRSSLETRHRYESVQKFRKAFNKGEFRGNERYIVILPERRTELNTRELAFILKITDQSLIAETIEDTAVFAPRPKGKQRELNRSELNRASIFPKPAPYTLEQIPKAVAKLNRNSPGTEQKITGRYSYQRLRYKDPRLPPSQTAVNWYINKYGNGRGFSQFISSGILSRPSFCTLEEIPKIVAQINNTSPETEQITSKSSYRNFRHKDPRLPPLQTAVNWFTRKYGTSHGFAQFILTGQLDTAPKPELYTLEQIPQAVSELNRNSPDTEQITNSPSYQRLRYKDPRLPSWRAAEDWYKAKYGDTWGFAQFVRTGKEYTRKPDPYTLEQIPKAVAKLNRNSPDTEQIIGRSSYNRLRYKDPRLPPLRTVVNWLTKKYGHSREFAKFIAAGAI